MQHRWTKQLAVLGLIAAAVFGCVGPDETAYELDPEDMKHYRSYATELARPDLEPPSLPEVIATLDPRTLREPGTRDVWNMPLEEALHLALKNNRIIRTAGTFRQFGNPALTNAPGAPSVYDPAIQESGVLFGNRGVEAALADFDAQFTTNMIWGRNEQVQNNPFFGGGLTAGRTLVQEFANFDAALDKRLAYGGSFRVANEWNYSGTNSPGQLFPSVYTGNLRAEYRHPLLAGAGTEFTRIAGPLNPNFAAIAGVNQGVVIARINNDIELADFEANVRNLVRDVENTYWDLYLAYRRYRAAVAVRDMSLFVWRRMEEFRRAGGAPPGQQFRLEDERQARQQFFQFRAQAQAALNLVYTTEIQLRRLIGLPVNDGKIIRPVEEPASAEIVPDWHLALTEALTERVELRRQKWQIKSLQLQLTAARSLTRPRFDFVSSYRVNAFGDQLLGEDDDDVAGSPQGLRSAFETLTQGDQTGWTLGFEFSLPIGFRSAQAQVRNYELRIAKAHDVLALSELEISHELAVAFQNVAANYATTVSNFQRWRAAQEWVNIFVIRQREEAAVNSDLFLRALQALAEAEAAYYESLVLYNQAITDLYFRMGTLLERNGMYLAEGAWTPEAYRDALRRAWARSHAIEVDHLESVPPPFAFPDDQGHIELPGVPTIHAPPAPADAPPREPLPVPPPPANEADEPISLMGGPITDEVNPFQAAPAPITEEANPFDVLPEPISDGANPFEEPPPPITDGANRFETFPAAPPSQPAGPETTEWYSLDPGP